MAFPGGGGGLGGMGMGMGMPGRAGMSPEAMQEQVMIRQMQAVMESCPGKSAMSGVMGFGLGAMFGLFMSSMRYDSPLSSTLPGGNTVIADLPWRQQLKHGLKDMGKASFSSAKNFGLIGSIFAGTECCLEGLRAKNDMWNPIWGGAITGGILARKGGPQAVVVGCLGFAAFSAAIEKYMRSEENERRLNVI